MKKIELNVSEVTSKAWELTKKHGLIIAVVLLAFSLITSSVSMMGFPWGEYLEAVSENDTEAMLAISESMGNTDVLSLLMGLISTILSAGILNIVLQISKGTMSAERRVRRRTRRERITRPLSRSHHATTRRSPLPYMSSMEASVPRWLYLSPR